MGFKKTTTMDLFNAINSLGTSATNQWDKMLREQAESDLRAMSIDYQLAAEQFLQDKEMRNDYQNWQKDMDDFMQKQSDDFKKRSKNAYTARMAEQMLNSYRPNFEATVTQRAWQSQKQDKLVTDSSSVQKIMSSSVMTVGDKWEQIRDIYTSQYKGGYIDHNEYYANCVKAADAVIIDYLEKSGSKAMEEAILKDDKDLLRRVLNEAAANCGIDFNIIGSIDANNNPVMSKEEMDAYNKQKNELEGKVIAADKRKSALKKEYDAAWKKQQDQNKSINKEIEKNEKIKQREEKYLSSKKEITAEEKYIHDSKIKQVNLMIEGHQRNLDAAQLNSEKLAKEYGNQLTDLDYEIELAQDDYDNFINSQRESSAGNFTKQLNISIYDAKETVGKTLDKMYDSKLAEYQSNNNKTINKNYSKASREVGDIIAGDSNNYEKVKTNILYQMKVIETQYGGNKLGTNGQSNWSDKYRTLLKTLEDHEKKVNGGSGSDKAESYASYIKATAENAAGDVLSGRMTYEETKNALNILAVEAWDEVDKWNETKGKSDKERKKIWDDQFSNMAMIKFMSDEELLKAKREVYPEATKIYEDALAQIKKGKMNRADESLNFLKQAYLTLCYNAHEGVTDKDMCEKISVYANGIWLDELKTPDAMNNEDLYKGKVQHWYKIGNESNEMYMGRIAQQQKTLDVVTTDKNGKTIIIPGLEDKMDRIKTEQAKVIAKAIGLSEEEAATRFADPIYKSDTAVKGAKSMNDYSSEMIFTDTKTNRQYQVVPVTKNEKVVSYRVIDYKTGETIKEGKDIESRNAQKEANKQATADQKAARENTKAVSKERFDAEQESEKKYFDMYNETNEEPSLVTKLIGKKANWSYAPNRQNIVNDTISNIDKKAKTKDKNYTETDFYNLVGMSKEDWKKKSKLEKEKYILSKE